MRIRNLDIFVVGLLLTTAPAAFAASAAQCADESAQTQARSLARERLPLTEPDPRGEILRRAKQLTRRDGSKRIDFGDPSPPDFSVPGIVRVYTTNNFALIWRATKTESAISRFLRGTDPKVEDLGIFDTDGKTGMGAWDPTVEKFGRRFYLYAGVMTPPKGEREARWPEDNWRRRVNAFIRKAGRWVRLEGSIQGEAPEQFTWLDHSYGHQFVRVNEGEVLGVRDGEVVHAGENQTWMFYEKVTEERDGNPWKTEIFARRLINPTTLAPEEVSIYKIPNRVWPSAERSFGGSLMEGPRPFKVGDWWLIGTSAGEYASDGYGIHLLASKNLLGPYKPYLTKSGGDLKDFGQKFESKYNLTWGAARPAFFEVDGQWWVLFHGIRKTSEGQVEAGQRDVFLAPVHVVEHEDRPPTIEIEIEED